MKLVHKHIPAEEEITDDKAKGRLLEARDARLAIQHYERMIRLQPLTEYAYNRLMILYRKQHEPKKEKAVIDAGIKAFENFYKEALRVPSSGKVKRISEALMKATGLADRKGKPVYQREPIGRWSKRRELLAKRIKNTR